MIKLIILFLLCFILLFKLKNNNEYFFNTKSYSQIGQDLKVLKYFDYKKNGYFIEVGANDH